MQARTVIINGFSKTYAMTGWRIGYAVAPAEIVEGMLKIQQHSVSCAPSIAQSAALTALNSPQDCVSEMVEQFKRRRDVAVKRLNEIGLRCLNPEGAFYAGVTTIYASFSICKHVKLRKRYRTHGATAKRGVYRGYTGFGIWRCG